MAACNVIVLCMAEGLLLGRGAVSPGMATGGLPFVQAGNTALYLQLLWYPVAVRVVSLFFESVFAGNCLFLCVCISVSHVNLCCVPALSATVCVCYMRVNLSKAASPLSLVCCKTENDTARSKQLSRATRMQLPWESHANRTSVPV